MKKHKINPQYSLLKPDIATAPNVSKPLNYPIQETEEEDQDIDDDVKKISEDYIKKNDNVPDFGFADLGILKEVVEEEKDDNKKSEEEDDKIFLNKEIFNEKTKEKIRDQSLKKPETKNESKIKINQRIISDLSLTSNFGSPSNNFYDTNGTIRYYSNIEFNKNFELYSYAKLSRFDNNNDIARRSQSSNGGGSRTFENMGINLSELSIKYSNKNKSLIAGKFTANFGTAWRWNRAINIYSIPQNYALTEKLGFAGIAKYGDEKKTGVYNLSFSIFTNDRKNLDNSLIHNKNSDNKSMAIAGDTRGLSSYVIANDIKFKFSNNEKLSYHIAYSKLSINKNTTSVPLYRLKKQTGLVFGMNYEFPIYKKFDGETIIEYAKIKSINGDSGIDNGYFTSNFILKHKSRYSLMVGNSLNYNKNIASSGSRTNISEINIGYEFNRNKIFDKLTAQIGYYQTTIKSINTDTKNKAYAVLVRYYKNF